MNTKTPPSNSDKRLFIVRHAHRDKPLGGALDNGLSDKGRKQAGRVREYLARRLVGGPNPALLSSPKRRCQQTLEPLAQDLDLKVRVSDDLDEGEPLGKKFKRFIDWWKKEAGSVTIICTHGDWIPAFTEELLGEEIDLDKAGLLELSLHDGEIRLELVLQDTREAP